MVCSISLLFRRFKTHFIGIIRTTQPGILNIQFFLCKHMVLKFRSRINNEEDEEEERRKRKKKGEKGEEDEEEVIVM